MAADNQDPHDRARRLARLIVDEILLNNRDKVAEGIRNDSLFDVLERELAEGRKYYEKNVTPEVAAQVDYFNQAVVDILVKGRGDIESRIW